MEKLCRTGWVSQATGRCTKGVLSQQKGKFCNSDQDCPTTDSTVFAECKCGFSKEGKKYCNIEGGDDEWVKALESYKIYIDNTLNCHNSAGWDTCNHEKFFTDWKC